MITLPDTYQLLHFETVDSTNEEAKRLAAQGWFNRIGFWPMPKRRSRASRAGVAVAEGKSDDHRLSALGALRRRRQDS